MSFEKNFCPSPWFHMRINNTGHYEYCRWAIKHDRNQGKTIRDQDPVTWFQNNMKAIRQSMLDGQSVPGCSQCDQMDQHGKISGRQKQRLKIGMDPYNFEKSLASSLWMDEFRYSSEQQGHSELMPQDWQIDLGNFCNSACVFCVPYSSSRLAAEFKRIGFIDKLPPNSWCDDPMLLSRFIKMLEQSPNLSYLHFIGGETLITPAFKTILQALIQTGLHQRLSIGFTTNLTVWDQDIVDLLIQFKEVNLGMSIECIHPLNDYVRYGSQIHDTMLIMKRWITVAKANQWLIQIRITPTALSIWHLDTVYEFAALENIATESCNFLNDPVFMRPSVLPRGLRDAVIEKLQIVIQGWENKSDTRIINTRDPNHAQSQICEDAVSYINYLENQPDESHRLPDLVKYLKCLERSRGNSILSYLPEYENILRSAGY
jgi:sulfatase maturation enzyme AslB (radical SAM superfamily)